MTRNFLFFLVLFPSIAFSAEPSNFQLIVGTYSGEVFNGSNLDPVETTFMLLPDGGLRGTYRVYDDEDGIVEGTISNAFQEKDRMYSFEWTDKYGEGIFILTFSTNYKSFNGYWSNYSTDSQLPWTGIKK
ncbi:hypothetical protein OAP18_03635 [Gammaproteobacteria bacterium]|nr:hypothetical protein [Gammaproteobacteria bacterium]